LIILTQQLFIGVDGGGTKSLVRIEDEAGCLLGREVSGPANVRISVDQSWQSILSGLNKILPDYHRYTIHAGMGLAGCEVQQAYQTFINYSHPFATLVVSSDSHVACLGAHAGNDGAIIIAGTGVVGYQSENDQIAKVSGWGFPHDDEGSGAWIGLEAMRLTLKWLDGRAAETDLAKVVYAHFHEHKENLLKWANSANATAFAELAPLVVQQSQAGDVAAIAILKRAALAIDAVAATLLAKQSDQHRELPCSLVGSIAPYLEPYLQATLRSRLRPSLTTPDVGAIMLVRNFLNLKKDKGK
jgi:glucosamine kinase